MLIIDLLYERGENYYYFKDYMGSFYDGNEMLCGEGLEEHFDFDGGLPKELRLTIVFEKPENRKGWFRGVFASEPDSEIDLAWQKKVCIYRDLMTFVQEETSLEEGDKFWFSFEY